MTPRRLTMGSSPGGRSRSASSAVAPSAELLKTLERTALVGVESAISAEDVKPKRFNFEDELEKVITSGKGAEMLMYPGDDIETIEFPKKDSFKGPLEGTDEFTKLDPSGVENVMFFHAPWKAFVRKYTSERYTVVEDASTPSKTSNTKLDLAGPYESELSSSSSSSSASAESDALQYFRSVDATAVDAAAERRSEGRHGVLQEELSSRSFHCQTALETVLGHRALQSPQSHKHPSSHKALSGNKDGAMFFMVRPKLWEILSAAPVEPFFFRMAVYDAATMTKVTEDVCFDMNPPTIKNLVPSMARQNPHPVFSHHQFVFNVVPASSLFLVLTVYKIPDLSQLESSCAMYTAQSSSSGVLERLRNTAPEMCFRAGQYEQLFAWSAVRLFDDKNELCVEGQVQFSDVRLVTPKTILLEELGSLFAGEAKALKPKPKHVIQNARLDSVVMAFHPGKPLLLGNVYDSSMRRTTDSEAGAPKTDPVYMAAGFPSLVPLVPHLELIHNAYVYPLRADLSKFFSSKDARGVSPVVVIRVSFHDSDKDVSASGLPVFYGKSSQDVFIRSASTSVCAGPKAWSWYDELKINLPLTLKDNHHLRFTFVSVAPPSRKDDAASERIIGWSWMQVAAGIQPDQTLRVFFGSKIPNSYTSPQHNSETSLQGSLSVHFRLMSSLIPLDPALCMVYKYFHFHEFFAEEETQASLDRVMNELDPVEAIRHLPVVIVTMLRIMCSRGNGAKPLEALLYVVASMAKELGTLHRPRQGLLNLFVEYGFNGFGSRASLKQSVHFSLCANYLVLLMVKSKERLQRTEAEASQSKALSLEELYSISWFVFDMSIRSVLLELSENENLNRASRPNAGTHDFLRLCVKLISNCVKTMSRSMKVVDVNSTVQFNSNIGTFMLDLLACCDRGYVIDIFCQYVQDMLTEQENDASDVLSLIKYDAIRIVMDYEHWIPANFPMLLRSGSQVLSYHLMSNAVCSAVVQDVFLAAKMCADSSIPEEKRKISIRAAQYGLHVLLCTFQKHEKDARLQSKAAKAVVAQIYSPLIMSLTKEWVKAVDGLAKSVLLAPLRRNLYIALLWVLEGLKTSFLKRLWKGMQDSELEAFWSIMEDMVCAFEWSPSFMLEGLPPGAVSRILLGQDVLVPRMSNTRRICAHVALSVLDLAELFVSVSGTTAQDKVVNFAGKIYVALLSHEQGSRVIHCIFDCVHVLALKFRREIWRKRTTSAFAQGLIRQTLRFCNSSRLDVRAEGTVLLYIMLRANRAEVGNFERSKVLSTTALAGLVAAGHIAGGSNLKASMASLSQLALIEYQQAPESVVSQKDLHAKAEYAKSVQAMARGLCRVLDDTIMVASVRQKEDPETIADLYFEIVKGYDHIPDLRITWFRALADFHKEKGRDAEAAMCLLRGAMLVHNFLTQLPNPASALLLAKKLFENVLAGIEEYADVTGEEACQTTWFTDEGYATLLEEAAALFVKAQMYEYAEQIFLQAVLPFREALCQYAKVALCHGQLASLYQKIDAEGTVRFLGRFFRIGFYGKAFGDLNGREFVHRGPGAQHLFELKDIITEHFQAKLGVPVEIAKDSSPIPSSAKNADTALIQLTALRTIFDCPVNVPVAMRHFREWTHVTKFAFDTPFQKAGGKSAQAMTSLDQWKRTTILEVRYPFPFVLSRQPVVSKSEIEVSPIEIAVEAMSQRNAMIMAEVSKPQPILMQLQQVLVGSVSAAVNSGPVEFLTFLEKFNEYPAVHVAALRASFNEFLSCCRSGLDTNRRLIDSAMIPLHEQMEADYKKLSSRIVAALMETLKDREVNDE